MKASRKKILFATCAAAFAAAVAAGASGAKAYDDVSGGVKAGESGGIANLPVCYDIDSRAVKIRIEKSSHPHALLLGKAWNHPTLGPMINFEYRQINAEFSLPLQRFLFEHECAHHALGHIKAYVNGIVTKRPLPDQAKYDFEIEADAYAVQKLYLKYGYGRREIEQIFDEISKLERQGMGDDANRATHPRPRQRLEYALSILGRQYAGDKNTIELRR